MGGDGTERSPLQQQPQAKVAVAWQQHAQLQLCFIPTPFTKCSFYTRASRKPHARALSTERTITAAHEQRSAAQPYVEKHMRWVDVLQPIKTDRRQRRLNSPKQRTNNAKKRCTLLQSIRQSGTPHETPPQNAAFPGRWRPTARAVQWASTDPSYCPARDQNAPETHWTFWPRHLHPNGNQMPLD
jgi:hypothetical protein